MVDIKEGFFKPREWLKGNLHDPRDELIVFDGRDPHKTEPWLNEQMNLLGEFEEKDLEKLRGPAEEDEAKKANKKRGKPAADSDIMRVCIVCFVKPMTLPFTPAMKRHVLEDLQFPLNTLKLPSQLAKPRDIARCEGLLDR